MWPEAPTLTRNHAHHTCKRQFNPAGATTIHEPHKLCAAASSAVADGPDLLRQRHPASQQAAAGACSSKILVGLAHEQYKLLEVDLAVPILVSHFNQLLHIINNSKLGQSLQMPSGVYVPSRKQRLPNLQNCVCRMVTLSVLREYI